MVLAPKTEHHGGEHAVRLVPMCPELRAILAEAFDRAEPGATLVVPMAARSGANFSTQLRRIVLKAGHKPWDRLLQNLRASCETDWVERYPAHAVAKWLGHSPKVAAEHYLMSREHHFEDVVNRGAASSVTSAEEEAAASTDEASECSAKCAAAGSRIRRRGVAENDRTRGYHRGYRGFCGNHADHGNRQGGRYRTRTYDP